ncbi:DUF2628 domain-containing protein [Hoeflea sp. TYP-13]|uniref:DUF2628 domain-containing protein n=1 Tax=Hoeflea sp. TYP-13 TaxID=3230023 RepID=UPI0034C6C1EC
MASYVVLTPPDSSELDENTVLIRDGFSIPAVIIPVLWLLWNRLWFAAIMLFLISVGIAVAISLLPGWSVVLTAASVLLSLFVALEGNGWRIAKKERQGWTLQSVIEAPNHGTAEEICFADGGRLQVREHPANAPQPAFGKRGAMRLPPAGSGPALGLLDYEDKT